MMKQGIEVWIVIPKPIPIFPLFMPEQGKPIRARKYPQKMKGRTFYLFEVDAPLEKREKTICVHENECYEVEVSVLVRRK